MSNPQCYRAKYKFEEATRVLVAAEKDLKSLSVNASPFAVRRARVKTAKREQSAAKDALMNHQSTCPICKLENIPQ
jgi:hypothetical protein